MEIRIATVNDKENLGLFYEKEVDYLLSHINYPFWDKFYPSKITVADNIDKGWQYLCIDAGKIIGAFVLNTDPQGDYGQGNWQVNLKEGEYYVIHTFCTASECYKRGIGTYMIDFIKEKARRGQKGASSGYGYRQYSRPKTLREKRLFLCGEWRSCSWP